MLAFMNNIERIRIKTKNTKKTFPDKKCDFRMLSFISSFDTIRF